MYHKHAMYKIFVIGYGEMFANIILGARDFGADIIGVLPHERILENNFFLFLKRIFFPSKDYSFIKGLGLKEFKYKSINCEKLKKELLKYNPDFIFVASWSEKLKKEYLNTKMIAQMDL